MKSVQRCFSSRGPLSVTDALRILFSCFSRSWGGLEIQALEEATLVARAGHHVWMTCSRNARLHDELSRTDLPLLPLTVSGYFHPGAILQLRSFLRKNQIDIIHCQLSKDIATLVPAMSLSGRRIPIVLSRRMGSYLSKKDLFHRFTYAHVSKVLAISEVIHRNVLETTPLPPERVQTFHHSIDTGMFSLSSVDRNAVRKEFGYLPEHIVVGFVGRFSPGKGHEEFLSACHILKGRYPRVRFLVVGEASYGEKEYEVQTREMSRRLGLDDVVTFAGFRKDIPAVMASFDIFAFPSHAESFGAVLIEAMAMERPVVSANCDGVLDIVVDGETGLFVPPRNAEALAAQLARLIDNSPLREAMGRAGRSRVVAYFNQKDHAGKLAQIYRSVLEG
jgi:glycosyltransferase involved in cell wall biosynthesis